MLVTQVFVLDYVQTTKLGPGKEGPESNELEGDAQ